MSDMYGHIDRDLMTYLRKECAAISKDAKKICKKHAKKAAEKIAANSPSDPKTDIKKYRDGWKVKTEYENSESIEIIVYNDNKPTLTWLLEKGHIGVDGKRVPAKPHIENNTDEQAKELLEELKRL